MIIKTAAKVYAAVFVYLQYIYYKVCLQTVARTAPG